MATLDAVLDTTKNSQVNAMLSRAGSVFEAGTPRTEDFELFASFSPVLAFYAPDMDEQAFNAVYASYLDAAEIAEVIIHEWIHKNGIYDEGLTQFLTELAISEFGIRSSINSYPEETNAIRGYLKKVGMGFTEIFEALKRPVENEEDRSISLITNFLEVALFGLEFENLETDKLNPYSYSQIARRIKNTMPFVNQYLSRAASEAQGGMKFEGNANLSPEQLIENMIAKGRAAFMNSESATLRNNLFTELHNNGISEKGEKFESLEAFQNALSTFRGGEYEYLAMDDQTLVDLYNQYSTFKSSEQSDGMFDINSILNVISPQYSYAN